jgi:hypothetical protein
MFNNANASTNVFSAQRQQTSSSSQNIFNNQGSLQNIFSQSTTQNTNINPFSSKAPVSYAPIHAPHDPNVQASIRTFHHQQDLLRTLNQFHQLQSDSNLQNLLKVLDLTLQKMEGVMNKAMKEGENLAKESTDKAIKFRKEIK